MMSLRLLRIPFRSKCRGLRVMEDGGHKGRDCTGKAGKGRSYVLCGHPLPDCLLTIVPVKQDLTCGKQHLIRNPQKQSKILIVPLSSYPNP